MCIRDSAHAAVPARVEVQHRLVRIEDFEYLAFVGFGVGLDLFGGQRGAGFRPAGRVADGGREVAHQKSDRVPQFLKMAQLVDNDRVAQVKVGRGGVAPQFYIEGLVSGQFFAQILSLIHIFPMPSACPTAIR